MASLSAVIVPAAMISLADPSAAMAGDHSQYKAPYPSQCPWMDTSKSADQRAHSLLAASTWEQKIRWLTEPAANNPDQTQIGFFGQVVATYPQQVPCTPQIKYTDGPWGVSGATGVTAFPVPIAQTASWNTALSYDKGLAMGDEAFRKGRNVALAPGVNIARTPFNGRNSEYMGEDPYLAGTMAAPWIRAMQSGNPGEPVEAVIKHFLGNNQELDRRTSNSIIDDRTLHEIYGQAFQTAIADGQPYGVMCAFPQVNGTFACQNENLIRDYLKGELGFKGWVVDDFFGDYSTVPSLKAGLDQELVGPRYYTPKALQAALDADPALEKYIDDAAFRVVRSHIAAGLFDHPLPTTIADNVSTDAHKAVALQMAEQGTVLLKNQNNVLPLSGSGKTIAVIGPTASATPTNGVSAQTACTASGGRVVDCSDVVAPLDSITARAAQSGSTVLFNDGTDLASAAATAASADVVVVFGYYTEGEGQDRTNINLDNNGDALVSTVAQANPNTVVVLETGSAVLMPWLSQVKGVLEAWYPGVEQGPALAALLWGDVNPSGKLPVTFPASTADLPTAGSAEQYPGVVVDGIRQVHYSEGLKVGYRWYESQNIKPLFSFGYGLSYTTFETGHLQATPRVVQDTKPLRVSFRVTNTGSRAGTQVEQVYLTLPASAGEPSKRLVGYTRVTLNPGQSKNVEVTVDPTSSSHPMSYWDTAAQQWQTPSGSYTVSVGSSVDSIDQSQSVRVQPSGSAHGRH